MKDTEQSVTRTRKQPQRPATGNGKGKQRTAAQLERQEKVFTARVMECKTVRQVASEMNLSLETVIFDCRAEMARRSEELGERRDDEKAAHLAMIEDLYRTSLEKASQPGTGALGSAGKALEMRAKILGLDAPIKIDVGVQTLVQALSE